MSLDYLLIPLVSYRFTASTQAKRGDPYKEKFMLNWRDVRTNKASELRARNPSNVNNFKMKSPYRYADKYFKGEV